MKLAILDWCIIGFYFVFLLYVTIRLSREKCQDNETYLLDGRRLTLPSFIATTVSTWYGGILGVGEYTYKHGLSNWLVFGVPYYLAALVFALFIAKRVRNSRLMSIPDQLQTAYNNQVATTGALWVFVMTVPAAYVLALGVLISLVSGWSLVLCVILATLFSTCYVLIGGFRSVVKTDWLQFTMMYGGFILMVIILVSSYGGFGFLKTFVPADHFDWKGGASAGYVISWYFIAMAALVEPAFYQRCYAARTPAVARKGLLYSILFWMVFDFMTTATGMYARAALGEGIDAINAFPLLADRILPVGIKGLFLVGLITTIQSTIDSYSLLAASTLGRDVLWKISSVKNRFKQVGLTRWGLLFSGLMAIIIAIATESIVDIWHKLGSLGTPALLFPLALSYSAKWKFRSEWAFTNMMLAPAVVAVWFIVRHTLNNGENNIPFSIEPIYAGMIVSSIILALDHFTRRTLKQ